MRIEQIKNKPPILFHSEFVNYLTHKRNKLHLEDAIKYVKWLDDVNACFNMDVVSDIYNLSVDVYRDFILHLRKHLTENHAKIVLWHLKLIPYL